MKKQISEANGVLDNTDATQSQVDAAESALASATTTFNAAKKAGTKQEQQVNKAALTAAVSGATANKETAVVSRRWF